MRLLHPAPLYFWLQRINKSKSLSECSGINAIFYQEITWGNIRENTGNFILIMADLHCQTRIQIRTQIQIPNPMATQYYVEHVSTDSDSDLDPFPIVSAQYRNLCPRLSPAMEINHQCVATLNRRQNRGFYLLQVFSRLVYCMRNNYRREVPSSNVSLQFAIYCKVTKIDVL